MRTSSIPIRFPLPLVRLWIGLSVLALLLSLPSLLLAQKIHFGLGSSWEYGVRVGGQEDFKPLGKGRISMFSFDVYAGLSLGRLNVYPTFIYSIPWRTSIVENPQGQYIPEGYEVVLPYNENGPSLYFSEDYFTLVFRCGGMADQYGSFCNGYPDRRF